MDITEVAAVKALINKFENAVVKAWIYDTQLGCDESYNPLKLKKSDENFSQLTQAKKELLETIDRLSADKEHTGVFK